MATTSMTFARSSRPGVLKPSIIAVFQPFENKPSSTFLCFGYEIFLNLSLKIISRDDRSSYNFQGALITRRQEDQALISASYVLRWVAQNDWPGSMVAPPDIAFSGAIPYREYLSSKLAEEYRKYFLTRIATDNCPPWTICGLAVLCPFYHPQSFDDVETDDLLILIHSLHTLVMTRQSYSVLLRLVIPTVLDRFPNVIKHQLSLQSSMLQLKKSKVDLRQSLSSAISYLNEKTRAAGWIAQDLLLDLEATLAKSWSSLLPVYEVLAFAGLETRYF